MGFQGFPAETFDFLRGLSANNTREWFQEHRTEYERYYRDPAIELVAALGPRLEEVAPGVRYEPRVGGSLFRVNRDTRFSKDKTPYTNHVDLWFWWGSSKGWDKPGFFFRMFADELTLGAGMHSFNESQLLAFREAVCAPDRGGEISRIIGDLDRAGYPVGPFGKELKRLPKGYSAPPDREWMLLQTGIFAMQQGPVPEAAGTAGLVDHCLERYTALWPLNRWLLGSPSSALAVPAPVRAARMPRCRLGRDARGR